MPPPGPRRILTNEQTLTLGFPNREVRRAFLRYFVGGEVNTTVVDVARRARTLGEALLTGDLPTVVRELQALFKVAPYGLDDVTERRYHSVVHAVIIAAAPPGVVLSETQSATGRTDLVVDLPDLTWIFELKRDGSTAEGLAQASRGDYAAAWAGRQTAAGVPKPVRVVCLNFGSTARNIVDWAELPA